MKAKISAVFIVLLILFAPFCVSAQESVASDEEVKAELREGVEEIISGLDLDGLKELYEETGLSEEVSFEKLVSDIADNGLSGLSADDAANAVLAAFKKSLAGSAVYMAEIVIILLITGLLRVLPGAKSGDGAAKTAFFAGYVVCASIAAAMLAGSFLSAGKTIDKLAHVMDTLTPVMITLLSAVGSFSSSSVMSPLLAGLTGTVFTIVKNVIFPAMIAAAVLELVTCISSTVRLTKFSELIKSGVKWFMGIVMTVFLGIGTLKGVTGAALDGISFKTAKYTIDKTVPFVGGMVSDTLDTLTACGVLAKNAIGAAGILILAVVMLYPLAALIIRIFVFKAGAAIAEPFSDASSVRMLSGIAGINELLFVVMLLLSVMAFIMITLFLGTADISVMMR